MSFIGFKGEDENIQVSKFKNNLKLDSYHLKSNYSILELVTPSDWINKTFVF